MVDEKARLGADGVVEEKARVGADGWLRGNCG